MVADKQVFEWIVKKIRRKDDTGFEVREEKSYVGRDRPSVALEWFQLEELRKIIDMLSLVKEKERQEEVKAEKGESK